MNILLDTHAFLWFVGDNHRLSETARKIIEADNTHPFLSIASLWEMAIKISLKKLALPQPYEVFFQEQLKINGIEIVNLKIEHTAAIATLPFHHRDPFDRLLAVQARVEKITLVSADPVFDAYKI